VLLRGVRATGLVVERGRCVGVATDGAHGARTYRADAVVLADGGFQGNPDMLRRFVSPHPETLKLRGPASARGDGIRYAEAAGAKLVGMETFYGHLLCADTLARDGLCPFPFVDLLAAAGVMVDASGQRFVDEGRGPHAMSHALAHHGNGLATIVFDAAMWESAGREFICPPNPMLVEAGGTLHRADDLDALARLAGLPPDALRKTVDAHNAAIASATLDRLAPPRSARKHKPQPFATPPYYAVPACVAITHSMGGVAVDDHARVLDNSDRPIPGLYAAGSTCGGLEGGPDSAYLGGLVKATVFGLLAAETACGAVARA
jgi:fumarate reductase flavoprotein subunit